MGVIVNNLSWPSVIQDTAANHNYGCIVILSYFVNPDFIV